MISKKVLSWLYLYLIITCGLATIFAIMAFIYIFFPSELLDWLLSLYFVGAPFVLFGIGIVRSIPLAEYVYTQQVDADSITRKESERYERKKRERRELSLILWTAGLTTILGINPWYMFFFYLRPLLGLGISLTSSLMVVALILLIMTYQRQLRQHVEFNIN